MKAIELFCGAGGMSLGAKYAGITTLLSIEHNRDAAATHRANDLSGITLQMDVRKYDFRQHNMILENPHWKSMGIDLIYGGPNCTSFSCAKNGSVGADDDKNMIPEFIRACREARPWFFCMENVPALAGKRHKKYFQSVVSDLVALGYNVSWGIRTASDFGLPTKRKRLFIVGSLLAEIEVPKESCFKPLLACDVLDLDNRQTDQTVVYAKNPVVHKTLYGSLLVNGRGKPINLDSQVNTITATHANGRHIYDMDGVLAEYHKHLLAGGKSRTGKVFGVRRITLEEAKAIQGFPMDFVWVGNERSQFRQVGNAVPPRMAEGILRGIVVEWIND